MADLVRAAVFGMQTFNSEHLSHFFSYIARGVTLESNNLCKRSAACSVMRRRAGVKATSFLRREMP